MTIEFDATKDAANIAKHGISLARAAELEIVAFVSDRDRYDEPAIVCTDRSMATRTASPQWIGMEKSGRSAYVVLTQRRCVVMESEARPILFDEDNPEWTEEDFARALPPSALPDHVRAAFDRSKGNDVPPASEEVTFLDPDVLAKFRATGAGWQTRINAALRAAEI